MAQGVWPVLAGLLVLLASSTDAGTCKPASCASAGGNGIFKYQPGTTYVYNLEGKTLTDLPEQQGEAVQLELKAVAEVNFGDQCTNTLQLKNVQVTGPNAKVYGNLKELEAYPVRFSFHDGQVDPEICADADDSNTALNIKRAVISLLQVSTPTASGTSTKHEVDIFGGCLTTFQIENSGGATVVTKSRNLNRCQYRETMRNRITTATYASNSEFQGSPLLDANLVVEMNVKEGVIHTASSHEVYLYRPFSNKEAGAKTVAHTTITFQSKSAQPPHACKANAPKSIIFDAPHGHNNDKSSTAAIVAAMQSCKAAMPDSVTASAASEFRHLVEVFRSSKKDHLLTVFGQVKAGAGFPDKDSARKLFFDALFRAGTGDCIQVAVELLRSKEIPEKYARFWYHSFSFARHATPESLSAVASLLDVPDLPTEAYLGIGSLAHRYCSEHNCEGNPHFNELVTKLAKPLAGGCKCSTNDQENKIIAVLKGLENMKGMNEATAELIRVCVSDPAVPPRVRVAALETARSDPCQPQIKKTTMELMANTQEDSEIRIKSYLACAECPCGKCANAIKAMLDAEPVNQVGSFIVSHLRNIRASASPDKALQKQHFSEIRTTKKFPFDFRKFSRNYEVSGLLDAFNVGSSLESNVIYSQQSYIPRSASLNLTTELFGHSVNLLEIGTRVENLDRVVAKLFGPKMYFKTHSFDEMISYAKEKLNHVREKMSARFQKSVRGKRSVPVNALEAFRKTVHHPEDERDINFDTSVKMFGHTLSHCNYHGDGQDFSADNFIDKLFDHVDSGISKAKSFNYDIKHHALFYENELSYATGLGFPLKMEIVASAAVHMKLDGKFDLHSILKDLKNTQFQFEAVPSGAVEVVGSMTVDAFAVEAGLKVAADLHTATGINVNVKALEGTGIDLTFGLPVKKQEIVNFKTEVLTSVQERGQTPHESAVGFTTKRKEFHGCFDQLSSYLGVTLCSEVGVPFEGTSSKAALFPLNGPSKLSFSIQADDVTSYKYKGYLNIKDEDRKAIEFMIDTPNSHTNRKVEAVFEAIRKPNMEFRAKFHSPIKSALAELIYVHTQKENSIAARVVEDDKEYFVKLGAEVSGGGDHLVYKPSLEYNFPAQSEKQVSKGKGQKGKPQKQKAVDYALEGTILVDKAGDSKKYTFNNVIMSMPIGKLTLNGHTGHDSKSVYADMKVQRDNDDITLKGKAELLGPKHFTVNGEFKSSVYPDLGVSVDWMYNRVSDQLESKLVLVHGQDLSSKQACLTAHTINKYHYNKETKDFGFDGMGTVTYPLMDVNAKIEGKISPHSFSYGVSGGYEKYQVMSSGHAMTGVKNPGDYNVEFEAKVLETHVKFETNRDIVSPHDNKFFTKLEMTPGGKYEFSADTTCKMEAGYNLHKVLAKVMMEGNPEPHTLDAGVEMSPSVCAGHVKVSVGSKDLMDLLAKVNKGSSPNGNFKAMVKDHLDGAGEFGFDGGKGNLKGHLTFVKVQRTVKAEGALAIAGTKRNAHLDISFDDSDPSKKISYSVEGDMPPNKVDAKHTLDVFGYKTVYSVKADRSGTLRDGTLKVDAELVLPNDVCLTGSLDHTMKVVPGDASGAWKVELTAAEKKGAPVRTVIFEAKANDCNRDHLYYDVDGYIIFKNLQGKGIKYSVASKHLPDGEKRHVEFMGKIENSLTDMAPMVHFKADIVKPLVNYYGKLFLANDANVEVTGKYQRGDYEKVPFLSEADVQLSLPTGELKDVKIVESWRFLPGNGKGVPCELKGSVLTTYNGANTVKMDLDMKGSPESGQGKMSLSLPKDELRVFQATYRNGKGPDIEREGSITFVHGSKEGFLEMKVKVPQDKKSFHFTANGRSPAETVKNFGIVLNSVRSDVVVESDATITADDKKVVVNSKYGRDWRNPLFEIGVVHPKGKSSVGFYFKQKNGATDHYEGEAKYEHNSETGYGKFDVLMPSFHDFTITINADSARLKLNQVNLVISNKPGVKGAKSISIAQTEAGESTIAGKLDYTFKDGVNGVLFEAAGTLKVRGENRACKVVFKKNVITSPVENGFEYNIVSLLGDQSFESVYKQTNKEVHFRTKGCKAADHCGVAEYLSKFVITGLDFSNEVSVDVDTTGLGLDTDVSFRRVTFKKDTEFLHKVEFNNNKKQLVLFKVGFDEKAGTVCLITPQREMAIESNYALVVDPKTKQNMKYKYEVSAWLDKVRQPDIKSTFLVEANYQRTGDAVKVNGEATFKHPSLPQDMVVKSTTNLSARQGMSTIIDIDVFAKKAQKIIIDGKVSQNQIANGYNYTSTWTVKSKGQKLDVSLENHAVFSWNTLGMGSVVVYSDEKGKRDLGFGVEMTNNKAAVFVKSPRDMLVDMSASYKMVNHLPSAEMFVSFLGCQGIVGKAFFETDHRFLYSIYKKKEPERGVVGEICFDFTKKMHNRVDWQAGSEKKELVNIGFVLDEKVTPDFTLNFDNMKGLIEVLRNDVDTFVDHARTVSSGLSEEAKTEMTDIAESLKKAQPNLKPLVTAYQNQLKALRSEFANDKSVQEMSDVVKKFVSIATEVFGQITEILAKIGDKVLDIFEQLSASIIGSLKRFMPQATESCNKIFNAGLEIFNAVTTRMLNHLQTLVELLKKHEPELKKIGSAVTEMTRDVYQSVAKGFKHLFKEVQDFFTVVCDQIKALPVFTMMQEKLQDMKTHFKDYIPQEQILGTIHEATKAVKDTLPTQELRDFVDCISTYIEKLLKKENVDYTAEGKKMYQKGVAALKSVVALLKAEMAGKDAQAASLASVSWPVSLKALYKIPLASAVHFSPINFLRSRDLPTLREYLMTYMPHSLNPLDLVAPFKSYGIILDTSHFFTFDKRHFTFKGACSYILAQDVTNGHFTLVLNLDKNGKFKSMELSDGKDSVEYTAQRTLLVNGQPSELPVKTETMSVLQKYHTVKMYSTAGIEVMMNMDYHMTVVGLSGFYHGHVRGILGDANYEQYDDFRLPNGEISADATALGNAYQVGGSCAPGVGSEGHTQQQESACTDLFSSDSPFSYAFPFFNPEPYREACNQFVSETADKKREFACRVAAAYVWSARKNGLLVSLPSSCAQCEGPAKKVNVGDQYSIKVPSQKADIVFVLEQVTSNAEIYKDLVVPMVQSLTADLKSKGITQVNFALIGYGHPQDPRPSHHTSSGKIGFDGKAKLNFGDAEKTQKEWGTTPAEKLAFFRRRFQVEAGMTPISDAVSEILHYPWTVGASRAVVLIPGTQCEKGMFFGLQKLRLLLAEKASRDWGIALHVVSPMEGFNIVGNKDPKAQKNVVGFDAETVYSFADGKKKTLEGTGNTDLRSEIEYSRDICVETAMNTKGAAYNARNFVEAKAGQRRQFLQVMVNKLSHALTTELLEDCECTLYRGLFPETRCKVSGRKESEQLVSQTETTKSKKGGGKKPKN